ncbi:MAG: phosphatidylserine decarboxylase family protein [Candidatus Nitronauta litoralis]|uniref:Phosphatidylserine decarboxylase proenzyme n=1 Tax=Candidatus Nitronauta litoralis TaxID=2705533 RepID=A0A7T0BY77_9BACT|nr:MAG: phosphatidylserine decarboxylase family protein [Candidatus Nitronauta litoralis]
MRIPIAGDGYRFILPLLAVTVLFFWLNWIIPAGLSFLALLFVVNFFRDPERQIPTEPGLVVSPADGKVVEIQDDTDPLLTQPSVRISVFLNVFNVHVNRVPVPGRILAIRYNKGKFLNAASHKASLDNEQNALLIETGPHSVLVKQIAGLIARRIVCWVREGQTMETGERFGLIRFGSRTDIFLPADSKIDVKIGDHVKGGSSILGKLPEGS